MPNICISCISSESTPRKFLLCCVQCSTFWHHRCHKPPVSDTELVAVISRFNAEKRSGKKNPTFVWRCGSCSDSNKPQSALPKRDVRQDAMRLASESKPKASPPPETQEDDDDDIIILENPPSVQVSSTKQVKAAQISSKSTKPPLANPTSISPAVARDNSNIQSRLPAPPTIAKKSILKSSKSTDTSDRTPSTRTIATRPTGIRIVDDPFIEHRGSTASASTTPTLTPSQSTIKPPLRPSINSALIPSLLDLHMSTDKDAGHLAQATKQGQDENSREPTLEYVTPPPPPSSSIRARTASMAPPPVPSPSQTRITQSLPPIAVISQVTPGRPLLLSAWIRNAHRTSSDATPDIWSRAAMRRLNVRTPPSTGSLPDSPSRKFKAQRLSSGAGSAGRKLSQTPFFLWAPVWLKAKKDTLPSYPIR